MHLVLTHAHAQETAKVIVKDAVTIAYQKENVVMEQLLTLQV
ncbi:hypothetical protein bcere0022_9500 [Bacillus cereus Rock3-44]|nr:hypothetical protein bcere0022_9500 [Bacillus cereus Rock3-44]